MTKGYSDRILYLYTILRGVVPCEIKDNYLHNPISPTTVTFWVLLSISIDGDGFPQHLPYFASDGLNRMRKFFSVRTVNKLVDRFYKRLQCLLWFWTAYKKDVMSSGSRTMAALKSFLTAMANPSLPMRWRARWRAIVGEHCPMPGLVSILWLYDEIKAGGVSRRCMWR